MYVLRAPALHLHQIDETESASYAAGVFADAVFLAIGAQVLQWLLALGTIADDDIESMTGILGIQAFWLAVTQHSRLAAVAGIR